MPLKGIRESVLVLGLLMAGCSDSAGPSASPPSSTQSLTAASALSPEDEIDGVEPVPLSQDPAQDRDLGSAVDCLNSTIRLTGVELQYERWLCKTSPAARASPKASWCLNLMPKNVGYFAQAVTGSGELIRPCATYDTGCV